MQTRVSLNEKKYDNWGGAIWWHTSGFLSKNRVIVLIVQTLKSRTTLSTYIAVYLSFALKYTHRHTRQALFKQRKQQVFINRVNHFRVNLELNTQSNPLFK